MYFISLPDRPPSLDPSGIELRRSADTGVHG